MERAPAWDPASCWQPCHQYFLHWPQRFSSSASCVSEGPRALCHLGWIDARGPAADTGSVEEPLLPFLSPTARGCRSWDWGRRLHFSSSPRSWLTAQTNIPACSNRTVPSCLNTTVLIMLCDRCHLVAWFYFFNDNLPWLSLFLFLLLFKASTSERFTLNSSLRSSANKSGMYLPAQAHIRLLESSSMPGSSVHLCICWKIPICQVGFELEVRHSKEDGCLSCGDHQLWPWVSGPNSLISVG